ncbi:bifunctional UDP-N-acetylglucosamine diphosphorylase/glucosamine-1-phosphate N-acetyltransferase GlmU [Wenzhouxiangella sp. AB-CW3]|uniref:bifunctional UDP-N-acetylglucosamine diphosphorylase/glucosamine-1-phosphate N-acetyltransferase GlmU n=1 Tax=Wenzhouxiangella sp. AB-CW3 TaxID=2771012 RepID=UPI00168AE972|nr:bifunctional UDP-N-acetylglucosamine diphosphorylase/glucosamine-1-phosphate N-acetyltransferase GlmU [Wenzhouxiangella sp. AB-CW3]QOC22939.1 bifunctional UDP-N-acetylglucosamine diphosphorylase/glucosamine-1-phosphate N-acetyltransferase GlmU [Wenzhouxiangella sp. AB-CW3]
MLEVIILAAGEGRRMNSDRPKVLQHVGGRPMLSHLVDTAEALEPRAIHVVVGAGADQVRQALANRPIRWSVQAQRLGTGHAAMQALPAVDPGSRVLVLPGDMPLVRPATLAGLLQNDADVAVLSFMADNPTGYGRILRDGDAVWGIREEKDASDEERTIREVNSAVLVAGAGDLAGWLDRVGADNAQGEYYLTDCVGLAAADGRRVEAVVAGDASELMGANDRLQMAALEAVFQRRARRALLEQGAALADPDTVQVRGDVEVGRDVFIDVNVVLQGRVRLGDGVSVGPGSVLSDCELAAGTEVQPYCVIEGAKTSGACSVGPFARLRAGTELAEGVKIGNFVETKNARLEAGAKASHLSYVGDAAVGAAVNLGAGTITCNYDGVNKHQTIIGERAFVGSNTSLVAPVEIGAGATIGAGSVISSDAPAGQLTLSRARQRSISGWKRPEKKP